MKKSVFAAAAVMAMGLLSGAAVAETVLIHGEAGPNRGARAKALQWFADEVGARSNGDLKYDIQWGGALFKANAALQSVADGVADSGTVIAVYYPQEMSVYGIADLPFENPDAWVGMRATDEFMRTNEGAIQDLANKNLVYIGTFTTSAVHIGCKGGAIRTVDDIKGKKVRGTGAYGKVFGELGANMVSMSIYKAYQGLDTGLIDCSQGYSYAMNALKQYEVVDSYTLLNWGQVGGVGLFMNKDVYDGLSDSQKDIIMTTGRDMSDYFGKILTAANEAAVANMAKGVDGRKVEIIELPAEERAKLVAAGEKYLGAWKDQVGKAGMDGSAMLDSYMSLIGKYSDERDTKGYPWAR